MPHRIITSPEERVALVRLLEQLKLPVTIEWRQGKDRSLDQNALQWLWATEVAAQLGDRAPWDVQADWKLRHGVPILRRDSEAFRETYDWLLKFRPFEEKITAMRDLDISITRAMTVKQMREYLDAIQQECAEHGFRITDPDPMVKETA